MTAWLTIHAVGVRWHKSIIHITSVLTISIGYRGPGSVPEPGSRIGDLDLVTKILRSCRHKGTITEKNTFKYLLAFHEHLFYTFKDHPHINSTSTWFSGDTSMAATKPILTRETGAMEVGYFNQGVELWCLISMLAIKRQYWLRKYLFNSDLLFFSGWWMGSLKNRNSPWSAQ